MSIDLDVKSFQEDLGLKPLTVNPLTIEPLTIAGVQRIAPVGVHIKELNQIAPLVLDHVRNIDPLRIDHLNITQMPSVNLSLSELPPVQINVGRVPTVGVALQQQLEMNSCYTIRARVLGLDLMRMELQGTTRIVPRDCARREQSHSHERSFPDVAPAGNPAIPSKATHCSTRTVTRCPPSQPGKVKRHPIHTGAPRFSYSLDQQRRAGAPASASSSSSVSSGG
jgi:hypothetical protein